MAASGHRVDGPLEDLLFAARHASIVWTRQDGLVGTPNHLRRGASTTISAYHSRVAIKVGIDRGVDLTVLRRLQKEAILELQEANQLEQTWSGPQPRPGPAAR